MTLPNATLGILGSGQLGRMLAHVAKRTGYRVHVFSPEADSPAGQVADQETVAPYTDDAALTQFARQVDVVTLEFENIPTAAIDLVAQHVAVHPSARVLHVAQHRAREKTFLQDNGFPVTPFAVIENEADLAVALANLGTPAILKTAGFGYDGKGQRRVHSLAEAQTAFRELGSACVLEALVTFAKEISVVAARNLQGETVSYEAIENEHVQHILDLSFVPAAISAEQQHEAQTLAENILTALDVVGVMCVEFFLTTAGDLLVNELAPRPHNSGHLTVEAAVTSQFEQQLRAVCGLPLGVTRFHHAAAMVNLLGDIWAQAEPDWAAALALPAVYLHLYGKAAARPGRKMGHVTALAATATEARAKALEARARL